MRRTVMVLISALLALSLASVSVAKVYGGKKILYVDSYHEEYPWSAGVTKGIQEVLNGTGVELRIHRMDTKRNKSEELKKEAALKAKEIIEEFKPNVVIASDDNASKYLIVPYYKNSNLPFVFCGLNWDASRYGFPTKNITGMVEVNAIEELLQLLEQFAKGKKVGFLGEETLSDRKEVSHYKNLFGLTVSDLYAKDMADWKQKFLELQGSVDMLIYGNVVSLPDWELDEAVEFALKNSKIPSGAVKPDPMPYALVGYAKRAEEQGHWAAEKALEILDGKSPSDIPVARNKEGDVMVNAKIAETVGIELPYDLVQAAVKIIE